MFSTYLELGFEHISDINAYDHILFIIALCAIYRFSEWKKVVILATAFTIGHSLTLALAAFDVIRFPSKLIEVLIPVTIIITAFYNVLKEKKYQVPDQRIFNRQLNLNYAFALFFGLIHGMGFSNFLKSAMMPGEEGALVTQLFAFNIGIELGQLMIILVILILAYVALDIIGILQREWNLFISGAAAGVAFVLLIEQLQSL